MYRTAITATSVMTVAVHTFTSPKAIYVASILETKAKFNYELFDICTMFSSRKKGAAVDNSLRKIKCILLGVRSAFVECVQVSRDLVMVSLRKNFLKRGLERIT